MFQSRSAAERSARLRRARPIIAMAAIAFVIGAIVGGNTGSSPGTALAARFVQAWTHADYASMYLDLDDASRRSYTPTEFAEAYRHALAAATATSVRAAGRTRALSGNRVSVPVLVSTRLYGTLSLRFTLQLGSGTQGPAIVWSRSLAFPGLSPGEVLASETTMPPRAKLLARDGSVLAEGAAGEAGERSSPLPEAARSLVGTVAAPAGGRRFALEALGVPGDAVVGSSGLELALDSHLRGVPGGELLAEQALGGGGRRVLASAPPRAAHALRTTISPAIERAALGALGSRYGGIVVMDPATGAILAVAGIALDSVQPPGSTFKMITVTSVLESHLATRASTFPYATFTTLDGVKLSNANGESCGGTLEDAFATSCNSVFAPLGVKLGAQRLVQTAERFGFNHEPAFAGAASSTLPQAPEIQGELALGSTAIGQGKVQASALQMAVVASTIADGGRRPKPTFIPTAARLTGPAVMSARVARTVRRLMIAVVRRGTGTSAAISGVTVAGKTGTAELKSQCPPGVTPSGEAKAGESSSESAGEEEARSHNPSCVGSASEPENTDAWFAAFAPATRPRVAVAVLLVKDGAGGDTAAPVAREVLEAALRASSR